MNQQTPRPRASVIIPAHNEGRVIERCLRALLEQTSAPLDVVVAVNGSTDDTVAIARSVPGVTVLDLAEPSKVAALNAGDRATDVFPRIYLDADIVLGEGAVDALIAALDTDEPRAAAPRIHFETGPASWPVRAFYDVFERLPYVTDNLLGLGVYGLSRAARARFEDFPNILGDDLYVQRLFDREERVVVPAEFHVQVPRTFAALLKVRTRVAKGNHELAGLTPTGDADFSSSTAETSSAVGALLRRHPRLAPQIAIYSAIGAIARLRARRGGVRWERDDSTR